MTILDLHPKWAKNGPKWPKNDQKMPQKWKKAYFSKIFFV